MWINLKWEHHYFFANTNNFTSIVFDNSASGHKIGLYGAGSSLVIYFKNKEDSEAFMTGFNLALNGLDFISGDNYIKPILASKNESLYKYMMLKEVIAELK